MGLRTVREGPQKGRPGNRRRSESPRPFVNGTVGFADRDPNENRVTSHGCPRTPPTQGSGRATGVVEVEGKFQKLRRHDARLETGSRGATGTERTGQGGGADTSPSTGTDLEGQRVKRWIFPSTTQVEGFSRVPGAPSCRCVVPPESTYREPVTSF